MYLPLASFPAKLLLFGEYTIINGGSALAIPYDKYQGRWERGVDGADLTGFFEHLRRIDGCDLEKLGRAKEESWVFQSDIPLGYGLGSSGALSAGAFEAFFDRQNLGLEGLKEKLAEIESFFHGKSSGLDPLVCYTGKAVHVKEGKITTLDPPTLPEALSLHDSGQARNGKPLIKFYLDRLEVDDSFDEVVVALDNFNERIISELLAGEDISKTFQEISRIQFREFKHMIPEKELALWEKGLEEDRYYMKLAGAGGGGCFLRWNVG